MCNISIYEWQAFFEKYLKSNPDFIYLCGLTSKIYNKPFEAVIPTVFSSKREERLSIYYCLYYKFNWAKPEDLNSMFAEFIISFLLDIAKLDVFCDKYKLNSFDNSGDIRLKSDRPIIFSSTGQLEIDTEPWFWLAFDDGRYAQAVYIYFQPVSRSHYTIGISRTAIQRELQLKTAPDLFIALYDLLAEIQR